MGIKPSSKKILVFLILATTVFLVAVEKSNTQIIQEIPKPEKQKEDTTKENGLPAGAQSRDNKKAKESTPSDTDGVKEIAELVIASADTYIVVVTGIAGLLLAVAGFAGWSEWKKLREANKLYNSLSRKLQDLTVLGTITHRNLFYWNEASRFLLQYWQQKEEGDKKILYESKFYLEIFLDNNIEKIEDKLFISFVYGFYGYVTRHIISERKGLEMCKKSVEYGPNNASSWYNAACYAAILGEKEDAIKSLTEAITLGDPYKNYKPYREEAKTDNDLTDHLGDQPEFLKLLEKN